MHWTCDTADLRLHSTAWGAFERSCEKTSRRLLTLMSHHSLSLSLDHSILMAILSGMEAA